MTTSQKIKSTDFTALCGIITMMRQCCDTMYGIIAMLSETVETSAAPQPDGSIPYLEPEYERQLGEMLKLNTDESTHEF